MKKVEGRLARKNTNMREAIPPGEKLALTLGFFATGQSYSSLEYQFRISLSAVAHIVPQKCAKLSIMLSKNSIYTSSLAKQSDWQLLRGIEKK